MTDIVAAGQPVVPTGPTTDRRTYLGGSDIGAVLGVDPFKSGLDVWAEKRGVAGKTATLPMLIGTEIERPLLDRVYAPTYGAVLMYPGTIRHPRWTWLAATPDAIELSPSPADVQAKIVGYGMTRGWGPEYEGPEAIPESVLAQVHWEMIAARAAVDPAIDRAHVIALLHSTSLRRYVVPFDAELADELVEAGHAWWQRYVIGGEVPPGLDTAAARQVLRALYPKESDTMNDATEEHVLLAIAYDAARRRENTAKREKEAIASRICASIGTDQGFYAKGVRVTWNPRKGHVSWKSVAEELGAPPALAEKHRGAPSRTLDVRVNGHQPAALETDEETDPNEEENHGGN